MSDKYLIKLCADWADEFYCEQFKIVDTLEHANAIKDYLIQNGGYFGTNEGWEGGELSKRDFTIINISENQAEVLIELLGNSFGTGTLDHDLDEEY